jgi:hypothetical protein
MSVLTSYASEAARDSAAPAASNTGLCIFRTDTKAIEVSDGTSYLAYNSDSITAATITSTRSLSFDGSNDYVSFAGDADLALSGTSACTIGGWIKCDTLSQNQHITGANTNVLSLEYWGAVSPKVLYVEMLGSNYGQLNSFDTYITQGDFHHVMFTYDGSGSTNEDKLKLYIDGSYVAFSFISGTIPTTVPSITNWYLGKGSYPGAFFNGQLDEFAVWNSTALSSTQITSLYGSGPLGTGVVANPEALTDTPNNFWRFEETSGTTASDEISGGQDGTINGATPGNTSVP